MQNFSPVFLSSLGSFSPSNPSKPPKLGFPLFPFIILLFLPRSQSHIRFDKIRLILGNSNRFCGGRYRKQGVTEEIHSSPGCICLTLSNVETQLWGENSIFLRQVFCVLQLLTVRLLNFVSVKATTNDEMRFPINIASDKLMRKYHVCWFPKARSISTQLVQCRHKKVGKLGVFLRSLTPVASRVYFIARGMAESRTTGKMPFPSGNTGIWLWRRTTSRNMGCTAGCANPIKIVYRAVR